MSLGCVNEIPFSELTARLAGGDGPDRIPLAGGWDVTERCNLSCAHCYINKPAGDAGQVARELSAAQICSILDEVVAEGCLGLTFTGGEPFLRPDMLEIYRHAKRRGVLVTLFTNGTLLTPAIADVLAEWRPYKVEITLYGATAETYERVTGVKGSFARCMRGIELLLERGLPLGLKSMLLATNRHELDGMMAFATERGLEFRWDSELTPRLDGGTQNQATMLSPAEVAEIDTDSSERVAEWRALWERDKERALGIEPRGVSEVGSAIFQCGAGLHSFHIDSRGRLMPCAIARRPSYDLTEGPFREGWKKVLYDARQARRRTRSACGDCEISILCSQCAGWSQLVHGDNETSVDYLCETAHQRALRLNAC